MLGSANVRGITAIAGAAVAALLVAGCSSSSSPSPSSSTPTSSLSPGATPGTPSGVPDRAHPDNFRNVSPAANQALGRYLPLMQGVAGETYYASGRLLVVTYYTSATHADKVAVRNLVRRAKAHPHSLTPGSISTTPTPRVHPHHHHKGGSSSTPTPHATPTYPFPSFTATPGIHHK